MLDEGLPAQGVLQIFHDLETYGYELEDSQDHPWLVQWLPDPDRTKLVYPPEDFDPPHEICMVVITFTGHSPPSASDGDWCSYETLRCCGNC